MQSILLLLNPFLALFVSDSSALGVCTCVYEGLSAATGVRPRTGGSMCMGTGNGTTGLSEPNAGKVRPRGTEACVCLLPASRMSLGV